jgi:hypothetical protein
MSVDTVLRVAINSVIMYGGYKGASDPHNTVGLQIIGVLVMAVGFFRLFHKEEE